MPISVALVTVALSKMIEEREKQERLNKTNKLISVFFSEFGIDLMRQLFSCVKNVKEISSCLNVKAEWSLFYIYNRLKTKPRRSCELTGIFYFSLPKGLVRTNTHATKIHLIVKITKEKNG